MNESHSSKRNRRPRRDNDVISPPPSVLTQSVLRPVLNPPGRLRPRLRVPADQLHHAAAVRVRLCSRARASAQGRLGEQQQEEEEERRQERATREQHHRGPEGAHGQSLVIHQNPFPQHHMMVIRDPNMESALFQLKRDLWSNFLTMEMKIT